MFGGKLCVLFGLLALGHAAFSVIQHRTYLRITEQEFTTIPLDIVLQCFGGLVVCCYGIVQAAGSFREIRATAELAHKTFDTVGNRPSFHIFHHRGQALYDLSHVALLTASSGDS